MGRKITAISAQKRNPQRVNIYLDDEFAFGLSRIVAAWLYVGQELDQEKVAALQLDDTQEAAYQHALNFLSYRSRTESEVRVYLRKRGLEESNIQAVLERLQRSGLLNDQRFAQDWVENRSEYRPRGRRALQYELRQKGITEEAIQAAVSDTDEEELAYQAALKKAGHLRTKGWLEFRQKMYAFLSRRGFSYEISNPVIARLWHELNDGSQSDNNFTSEEVET
jgi:regulatory protein